MVHRLLISNRYLVSSSSATLLRMRRPQYLTMNSPLSMGAVANSPRPVLERPTRNDREDELLLGGTGLYRGSSDANLCIKSVPRWIGAIRILSAPPPRKTGVGQCRSVTAAKTLVNIKPTRAPSSQEAAHPIGGQGFDSSRGVAGWQRYAAPCGCRHREGTPA